MGEMADFFLEEWEGDDLYWDSVMYEEETDSFIGSGRSKTSKPLVCKFCGKKDLYWDEVKLPNKSRKWVMFEKIKGEPHFCPNHRMPLELLKYFANRERHKFEAR